ncbi:hypothetical protein Dsin_024402 [Dipteronia sinensis]|uniref:RNase H type-1 domain-containing protein n=1 Tax=Dipteronia sinensis TaxID=43782 RepID=A0AAD9ZUE0_9ROSI|nr:hypothetical protein Dsin_024402 [Dipteronia sinensis]
MKEGSRMEKLTSDGFIMIVGKGERVQFLTELRVDDRFLKEAFPYCYALAVIKSGTVMEFGAWSRQYQDAIAWSYNPNGIFSVGSFSRMLEATEGVSISAPMLVWQGLPPPKIEVFLWQLWKGRILVKEGSLFEAIVWTIWECKNKLVFKGRQLSVDQAIDAVKFWVVWWFKHLGVRSTDSIEALLCNVHKLYVDHKKISKSRLVDWIPPPSNKLKFNVDGSVSGKPVPGYIGGILRDLNGKILCLFSQFLGILDSNSVELWAIQKVVLLCHSNVHLQGRDILVVSDSIVAVVWVNKGDFGSVENANIIRDIRSSLSKAGGV